MVLIDMEIPNNCFDCPCCDGSNGRCNADNERRSVYEYRPYWCPLKPFAPHEPQITTNIPAADVVEVRHGRWVHGREVGREYLGDCLVGIFYDRWTCSECGYVVDDHEYSGINYKFCPNCGAKMKGGVNE